MIFFTYNPIEDAMCHYVDSTDDTAKNTNGGINGGLFGIEKEIITLIKENPHR